MKHIPDKLTDLTLQNNDEPHKRSSLVTTFLNQFIPITIINNLIKIISKQNTYFNMWHSYHYNYIYIPVSHPSQGNSEFLPR